MHLGGTVGRPYPLDGAAVAIGQLCGFGDALARLAQCHNAGVRCPIAFAPSTAACGLCQGDTLALSLAPIGVIVVGHLQGDLQEHRLNGFEHDAGDALGVGREVGQVHDAGDGKSRASRTNCLNQLLGLGQGKTTNPVDLLGNHHFTGLKIGNHAQQLGAVGTGTRCLLPIDCRDIIARCLRLGHDGILSA